MKQKYHYTTVTEAIIELKQKGYFLDFNLEENCTVCNSEKFNADEFEIKEVYRYEGDSDPADVAIVYGIQSINGKKGILVNGYGISSDGKANAIMEKLKFHTVK